MQVGKHPYDLGFQAWFLIPVGTDGDENNHGDDQIRQKKLYLDLFHGLEFFAQPSDENSHEGDGSGNDGEGIQKVFETLAAHGNVIAFYGLGPNVEHVVGTFDPINEVLGQELVSRVGSESLVGEDL